jgi:hypothetical protein
VERAEEAALAQELEQCKGLWVGIHQGHVIASGGSIAEVRAQARAQSVNDPFPWIDSAA